MNGQGRPPSLRCIGRLLQRFVLLLSVWWCAPLQDVLAEPTSVRVRFEWAGGEPSIWVGSVTLDRGQFSEFRILGLDADQPGAYVVEPQRVRVWPRFATQAAGFEVMVSAELDDPIRVRLAPESDPSATESVDTTLRELLQGDIDRTGLPHGHRLTIRRAPADTIRVRFPQDHMIFSPGQHVRVDMHVVHTDAKPGASVRARFRIREAGSGDDSRVDVTELLQMDDGSWSRTETLRVDEAGQVESLEGIELPMPDYEGSFELTVDLSYRLPSVGSVAKRIIPFIVLDPQRPPLFGKGNGVAVTEFDPSDPDWRSYWIQLQNKSNLLPGSKKGPWSNVSPFVQPYGGDDWTFLPGGGWVGYTLSGAKANMPHLLEVEFPAGMEQDVGISIVEPRADESLEQLHADAGITIGDQDLLLPDMASSRPLRHRVVFWPRSNSPVVVITNRNEQSSAAFGKIRLEAFPQGLPISHSRSHARKRIAVLRSEFLRTLFQVDFGETPDFPRDNWSSYLTAATRLIAYLRFAGYDGATLNVMGDGSALYPSSLLHPTARFDLGTFARERQDPIRKDILEMLFQLFDREGLTFIPAVEFATPLPELEQILARGEVEADGIELLDSELHRGSGVSAALDGLAPYYNPLNEQVQLAMLGVIHELTERYDHHRCFRGIRVDCRSQGYTQLPGISWAMDPKTLEAFARQVRATNDWKSSDDVAQQLRSRIGDERKSDLVKAWIQWRADRLTAFYGQLASQMKRQDRRVFVSVIDLMESAPWQQRLRPALPRQATARQVLLELGMDVAALQATENLTVLRPNRIGRLHHLGSQAVNLEANEMDIQRDFESTAPAGVQFHYEAEIVDYPDFDRDGPTRRVQHRFLSTFQRAALESRRHLALGIAQYDDNWIFEGGAMFPLGQEPSTHSFFQVFRELPDRAFHRVELAQAEPVQAWMSAEDDSMVAYFVNTSPWEAKAGIQWRSAVRVGVTRLGSSQPAIQVTDLIDHYSHDATIEPYGIYALHFDSHRVELLDCQTELPSGVARHLRVQLDEIVSREKQIESRTPVEILQNPSFDEISGTGQVRDWFPVTDGGGIVEPDSRDLPDGQVALRMFSPSEMATTQIRSRDFAAPESGRLVVKLKLRKSRADAQPPLVLQLESSQEGYEPHHYFESIPFQEFGDQGLKFVDLPTDPDLRLRISLELLGAGEVWVDDIRLYDRWIFEDEKKDLKKILHRAAIQVEKGDFSNCYQTLSGYWPRFLLRHVPPPRLAIRPTPVPTPKQEPSGSRFFDLKRLIRLRK